MIKPSENNFPVRSGYRNKLPRGWIAFPKSTINGKGYEVEFARVADVTCDTMCDALNGYYTVWGDFGFDLYIDGECADSLVCSDIATADKLFDMMTSIKDDEKDIFDCDDACTAKEKIICLFKTLKDFVD